MLTHLTGLFLTVLGMSFTAGIIILLVLAVRLALRRAPRLFSYLLWGVVLFRLLCPVSFESPFSLLPSQAVSLSDTLSQIKAAPSPDPSAIPQISEHTDSDNDGPVPISPATPAIDQSLSMPSAFLMMLSVLWLTGCLFLVSRSLLSLARLQKRLKNAVLEEGSIYSVKGLETPFVMGVLRPRIYLPADLSNRERDYIILHEKTHIRRLDPLFKLLGSIALYVHWFNPLVWLAFWLADKDMEISCDEAVIRQLGHGIKKEYSASLLALAGGQHFTSGAPLGFGESDTKERIKHVLGYQKKALWITVAALAAVLCVAAALLGNPPSTRETMRWAKNLRTEDIKSIELLVQPHSKGQGYHQFLPEEFAGVVSLINESRGKFVPKPEAIAGSGILLYIVTTDGVQHQVGNVGNVYFTIDGDCFDAGYDWLSSWPYVKGDAPVPEDFAVTTAIRMSPSGITIGNFCENLSEDVARQIYGDIQNIMKETYEDRERLENYSVYFQNQLETDGRYQLELLVGVDWTTIRDPKEHPLILGMEEALETLASDEEKQIGRAYINGWLAELMPEFQVTERIPVFLRAYASKPDMSDYELYCNIYTESGEETWVPMKDYYLEHYKENPEEKRQAGWDLLKEHVESMKNGG